MLSYKNMYKNTSYNKYSVFNLSKRSKQYLLIFKSHNILSVHVYSDIYVSWGNIHIPIFRK